ncbi:hypothetical protein [Antrihabitans cavernicola]|uniref:Bacterial transcriptional activator domain-containing protein n=1 Tax=Antrihabitans cavernicola TaxID=2495913 RepID=A0A5A7S4G5_9NOCA|nr:hypothetical protein [Spelaeibacter cavernicola]KAA0019473.1 hypothetical protein FOY51_22780 [Spelaeibacter cavernicola]
MTGGGEQPRPQPRGRKSWAVLARVALAETPRRRADLAAELFGETDDPLGALRWTLADVRRSLGRSDLFRGDPIELHRNEFQLDVWDLDAGTLEAGEIGGELLDGVDVRDCPEFDMWLMLARMHCAQRSRDELRNQALRLLAFGDTTAAVPIAERVASLEPMDESAQELFLRALVAAGRTGVAKAHLAACEGMFASAGLRVSPAMRSAAEEQVRRSLTGRRAGAVAESLLRAGTTALDAGAADAGVETLRHAEDDAARSDDPGLRATVQLALGSALVHAVRGSDGEGAIVLHRALLAARAAGRLDLVAEALRELAYVDVQAGRHGSAALSLSEAEDVAETIGDDGVVAAVLAIHGMNEADCGRHLSAIELLSSSAEKAAATGRSRQHAWSLGLLSRSLLLAGRTHDAEVASAASLLGAQEQRWTAFQPFPQAMHAECLFVAGRYEDARNEAELAFALGCEVGDPCWEGVAARTLGLLAEHAGDDDAAWEWFLDARRRCDRVSDRYVWISAYIGAAQLELAARVDPALVRSLAAKLQDDAIRTDLPEFLSWSLVHQIDPDDPRTLAAARATSRSVDNPALHARIAAVSGL